LEQRGCDRKIAGNGEAYQNAETRDSGIRGERRWKICLRGLAGLETIERMSQQTQLRVAASLNLAASCAGVVFFVFNLYRLIAIHQIGSRRSSQIAFLFLYGCGAYFFWGRYRTVSAQLAKLNRSPK
jgi:hypothetical protein